ncbi:Nucleotide-binding oligomerization domain-containing 2 [Paramuricea clavata]|uniref:Nucleotide-binding oligomerization domain-containing 2 n=1 Tax=Paramuricea clavata TaxID=317549 RepID=A0A6S7JWT0_PARCT|nr:Nucleotide-binding oligomerization domain-containing 2 [Paramuricea clavata]
MKLNISKCKELIIDFAKDKQEFPPLIINGVAVDRVSSARVLGLIVRGNMNWNEHVNNVVKKPGKRQYMLRGLKRSNADTNALITVEKAAEAISKLGYSEEAYEEAKKTLIRKFGGNRRQIQAQLEDFRNTTPFKDDDVQEIEKFADNLVHTIVMLKEQKLWNELKPNSMLYLFLIEKIPQSMLASFFRWLTEKYKEETLEALSDWMVEDAEFLIRALETREGMATKKNLRTQGHIVVSQPWARAKLCMLQQDWSWCVELYKVCYRCLSENHLGKDCPRTRVCGQEGCKSNHHQLLHETGTRDQKKKVNQDGEAKISQSPPSHNLISQSQSVPDLKADENSSGTEKKTYVATLASKIVEEVAGVLGLSAPYEPVTVQVLNENIETFDTKSVDLILENSDGNVQVPFQAFRCPRQITGSYKVVDWRRYQKRWLHLGVCNFPKATLDPLVDVLIGQDQVDLHYARCDVRGKPGEPSARLGRVLEKIPSEKRAAKVDFAKENIPTIKTLSVL